MTKPLALVYTMHKVGSSTIMNALRSIDYLPGRGYPENLPDLYPLDQWEKVITMVRDPVARNASYFFENWPMFFDEEPIVYDSEMIMHFIEKFDHISFVNWFDEWLEPHFGVDVMGQTFSRNKGWQIYDDLLLIRTENIMGSLQDAFAELFDLPEGKTVSVQHRGETVMTRPYAEAYQRFIMDLSLPSDLLDLIYGSKFMEHFYYKKEIATFKRRWS